MGDTAATTTANTTTNTLHLSSATLTIRLIKSFEYRTVKNLILNGIDLTTVTPAQLKAVIAQSKKLSNIAIFTALVIFNAIIEIQSTSSLKPYLNNTFGKWLASLYSFLVDIFINFGSFFQDTLKIYTKAHGSKVSIHLYISGVLYMHCLVLWRF